MRRSAFAELTTGCRGLSTVTIRSIIPLPRKNFVSVSPRANDIISARVVPSGDAARDMS